MTDGLSELAAGVFGWFGATGSPESPNAGAIVDEDGITVVDSLLTPADAAPFAEALARLDRPVRRLVLTGSHIDRSGGTTAFPFAAVYGSSQTSAHLEQPPNVAGYRLLYPEHESDFDDHFATRRVTHVVDQPVQLTPAVAVITTGGESADNLVVVVAGAQVCFAGAMLSVGVTPLAFDGDPGRWADATEEMAGYATLFVPGFGPPATVDDLTVQAAYLRECVTADGDPGTISAGPWDEWSARDRDEINVERADLLARDDPSPPKSMLRRLGMV